MKTIILMLIIFSSVSQAKVSQSLSFTAGLYQPTLVGLNETSNTSYELTFDSTQELGIDYEIALLSWVNFGVNVKYRFLPYEYSDGTTAESADTSIEYSGRLEFYGGITAMLFVEYVMREEFFFAEPTTEITLEKENIGFVRVGVDQILGGKRQSANFGFNGFADLSADGTEVTERSGYGVSLFVRLPSANDSIDISFGGTQSTKTAKDLLFTDKTTNVTLKYQMNF